MKRTVAQIAEMAGGRLLQGAGETTVVGVATDTRHDMTGRLFVPLVGERFDAHEFWQRAQEQGAVAALWQADRPRPETTLALIEVEDTLIGLQRLSASYRDQLAVKIVGVTGSNGKTSTKDMIASVLGERFKVQKTQGNFNNHIGLPLMMLALEEDTEVAVLEMGMNHFGEIDLLAALARPDIGVITNIGEAHIEFLGSRAGIADAKCELIERLTSDGTAILLGDEPLLRERAGKTPARIVWFGFQADNDIQAVDIENLGVHGTRFALKGQKETYTLPVLGLHQVGNALAAIAVGRTLGMSEDELRAGLGKAKLTAGRVEAKAAKVGGTIIDDTYNASPTSMKAALQMLADMKGGFKTAVLGGMLELGPDSQAMHQGVGAFLAELPIDKLLCIGDLARDIAAGARAGGYPADRIVELDDKTAAVRLLEELLKEHAQDGEAPLVLVKASNGIKLAEVVRELV